MADPADGHRTCVETSATAVAETPAEAIAETSATAVAETSVHAIAETSATAVVEVSAQAVGCGAEAVIAATSRRATAEVASLAACRHRVPRIRSGQGLGSAKTSSVGWQSVQPSPITRCEDAAFPHCLSSRSAR